MPFLQSIALATILLSGLCLCDTLPPPSPPPGGAPPPGGPPPGDSQPPKLFNPIKLEEVPANITAFALHSLPSGLSTEAQLTNAERQEEVAGFNYKLTFEVTNCPKRAENDTVDPIKCQATPTYCTMEISDDQQGHMELKDPECYRSL